MAKTDIPPRYRVIEEVGQGGMAVVYRAQDEKLKREVAIKLLHAHLASEPESKARLEREAQAVAKLHHDNILEIFDYSGLDSAASYIVTEFIDGPTLKQFFADRALTHPEIGALVAIEVGGALSHAHSLGILHRDVKPENVMITRAGLLKLMDFGIAQIIDMQRMTVTGQLLGSPAYMAPEIIEGKPIDFRTDVFAVGIMLYQLTTGQLPFWGKNPHEVLKKITDGKFADPRSLNRRIGDDLARIIAKALARQPADRYADVSLLVADLRAFLDDRGLGDVRGELRRFFTAREAYEAELTPRLVAALAASGRAQLAAGRTARALELWNQGLELDGKNQTILDGLRRLEGRRRLRVSAVAGLGALVLAGAAYGAMRFLPRAAPSAGARAGVPPPLAPPSPVGAAAAHGVDPAPAAGTRAGAAAAAKPSRRLPISVHPIAAALPTPAPTVPSKPPAESRLFTLSPMPQVVDVYLDGVRKFAFDPEGSKTLPIPWDHKHTITFKSPSGCCAEASVDVGPDLPAFADNVIAKRLPWRPARLTVTTEPAVAGAKILVETVGERGARAMLHGEADMALDIPFGANDEVSRDVNVSVLGPDGAMLGQKRVSVRAGQPNAVVAVPVKVKIREEK